MAFVAAAAVFAPGEAVADASRSAEQPAKKRRRTNPAVATDDCFTCRNRAVKCDRARPYCAQCIQTGKDCSGYKTKLTWGVGIASRGKLRGQSCPVAKAGGAHGTALANDTPPKRKRRTVAKRKTSDAADAFAAGAAAESETRLTESLVRGEPSRPPPQASHALPASPPNGHGGWSLPMPAPPLSTSHTRQWAPTEYERQSKDDAVMQEPRNSQLQPGLQQPQPSISPQADNENALPQESSVVSFGNSKYHASIEYRPTSRFLDSSATSSPGSIYNSHHELPASAGSASSSFSSSHALGHPQSLEPSTPDYSICPIQMDMMSSAAAVTPLHDSAFNDKQQIKNEFADSQVHDSQFSKFAQFQEPDSDSDEYGVPAIFDSRFSTPFFAISTRMQTLMEYYSRNICPYLVAFDSVENPYRKQILQLALTSEGLQNAIAALSINNLRMRRNESMRIGFVQELSETSDASTSPVAATGPRKRRHEPTSEESTFKQLSIDQLNSQLANKCSASDDSVLATLLILCLFHVCDSGFTKFRTQLAGVQKLMSLRRNMKPTEFTRWVETFFVWFDVMNSSVNDREMQVRSEALALLDDSVNLDVLEQYSGIDGRLFKLISRLSRLNVLAQGRPVKRLKAEPAGSGPVMQKRHYSGNSELSQMTTETHAQIGQNLSGADFTNLDGNGWGSSIMSSDEDDASASASNSGDEVLFSDDRYQFWAEWHDVRERLNSWSRDSSSPVDNIQQHCTVPVSSDERDMAHINQFFRFSALIYTERLAHPTLPSSSAQFQSLVSQALLHMTALPVTSRVLKFLLWPLFITGTECVHRAHRNLIRIRCRQIMEESGFYNNLASLEVLERVWGQSESDLSGDGDAEVSAERRDSSGQQSGKYGQAFRWRRAMSRADGEYIIL